MPNRLKDFTVILYRVTCGKGDNRGRTTSLASVREIFPAIGGRPASNSIMLIRVLTIAGLVCLAGCVQRSDGNVQLGGDEANIIVNAKGPESPIAKGANAEFVVKVTNAGPHDATNVHIVDVVGVQSKLVSMTCTANGGAECPQPVNLAMLMPKFPKGGGLDFHVVLRLADNQAGTIVNSFVATYDFDRDPNDNAVAMDALVR